MEKDKLFKSLNWLAIAGVILAIVAGVSLIKSWDSAENLAVNSITVSGESKVSVSPDIATISFTIDETKPTSKEAQASVSSKMDKAKAAMKALKIEDKDIKTSSYSLYPKYNYQYCPTYISSVPCSAKQKLEGYEVSHNVTVKVRDVDSVGKVLDAVAQSGINNITGPSFTVDDIEKVRAEARGKAIEDAKAKAKILADQLNVSLDDLISFNESGASPREYMYVSKVQAVPMAAGSSDGVSIPQGENEINVNVTLTYRIK